MTETRNGDTAGSAPGDAQFVGAIPDVYERLLVPMIFSQPAEVLATAVALRGPVEVLETAAGTGVLTRAIHHKMPAAKITATDLNGPMLRRAEELSQLDDVTWATADAQDLPFDDASFDVVACQFGVMFFPDKHRGYAEARRVLRPGGAFVFNVWDRIENNEVPHVITQALVAAAPEDPLTFMSRTPHGYFDIERLVAELAGSGLVEAKVDSFDATSRTTSLDAAIAFCQGTPLRGEIEKHSSLSLESATATAAEALLEHFGPGTIEAPIRWFQISAVPAT